MEFLMLFFMMVAVTDVAFASIEKDLNEERMNPWTLETERECTSDCGECCYEDRMETVDEEGERHLGCRYNCNECCNEERMNPLTLEIERQNVCRFNCEDCCTKDGSRFPGEKKRHLACSYKCGGCCKRA